MSYVFVLWLEAYEGLCLFNKELLISTRSQGYTHCETELAFRELVNYIILSAYFIWEKEIELVQLSNKLS